MSDIKKKKTKSSTAPEKKKKKSAEAGAGLQGKKEKRKVAKPMTLTGSKAVKISSLKTAADLKEADYNPRQITKARLKNLSDSISNFGDLSGIVFNGASGSRVLISGHQRIKSVEGWDTEISVKDYADEHGTIALGYLHATDPETKKQISFPLRIVNWSDKRAEYAANIAANAHGGEFDHRKLASLVDELDTSSIPASIMGIDPGQIRSLQQKFGAGSVSKPNKEGAGRPAAAASAFAEVDEDELNDAVEHQCPRCNFRF